jgi:DedD protein
MGLLDIFKRDSGGATPAAASANVMSGEQAKQARMRAKRRLIGAVVLLGVGVVAFPLLFETQPRPIPVDIPIVIPPRDAAPPLPMPAPHAVAAPAAPAPVVAAPAEPSTAAEPAPEPVKPALVENSAPEPAKPAQAASPTPKPAAAASPTPKPAEDASPAPKPAEDASPAPKPAEAKPAATAAGRFVVQIGAFAEASAVRDVRSKAQKAGLKTFTQVVKTTQGQRTRVRVGPFASREDAEKAAAQVKAAGLPSAVLAL